MVTFPYAYMMYIVSPLAGLGGGISWRPPVYSLLILNVYLPTNYSDEDSAASYQDICAKICTRYSESDCIQVLIVRDINCQKMNNINNRQY